VTPPPRKRPRGVSSSRAPSSSERASPRRSSRSTASASRASPRPAVRSGSSSRSPRSSRSRACMSSPSGSSSRECRHVSTDARRVPPAQAGDGRDRADPDPEIVAPEPVPEIVVSPQIAIRVRPAEVRGLVPAVAGAGEGLHDRLEIGLHRVRLPDQLVAVGVREARPGLRLELVAREVLRAERDRGVEVARQIVGALARDAVDQVEREVVETGRSQGRDRGAYVGWRRAPLEHLEQVRLEALRTQRDTVDAVLAQECCELRGDGLRVRLDRHLVRCG
jgi:hypothetical protein